MGRRGLGIRFVSFVRCFELVIMLVVLGILILRVLRSEKALVASIMDTAGTIYVSSDSWIGRVDPIHPYIYMS